MFSQTAEYALRACVYLAMRPDEALTTQQISEKTRVPSAYLSKVLQSLVRAGLVHSQRGFGGGFQLTNACGEVTILEIVNAVDPICRIETCPLGLESHGRNLCPLHKKMDDALRSIQEAFGTTTLEQVIHPPAGAGKVVSVPLTNSDGRVPAN